MDWIPLVWIVAGLAIVLLELFLSGFIAVFIGIGALVTGIAITLGLPGDGALPFLVFVVVTVGTLLGLRARFSVWFQGRVHQGGGGETDDDFVGREARVIRGFGAEDKGRGDVDYRGSTWAARADLPLSQGDLEVIKGRENLTLIVAPQEI